MKWEVTTAATTTPISYAQSKTHQRLPDDGDREYVEDTILDAIEFAETYMQNSLSIRSITATYYTTDNLSKRIELYRGPVVSVTSVSVNGTTLATNAYSLERIGNNDYLVLNDTPTAPVIVVYRAGYSTLPRDIRRALLNHVASMYENREAETRPISYETNFGLRNTYDAYKRSSPIG